VTSRSAVVIGAGPAGLACATRLSLGGWKVTVLEADSGVGGMSKSINLWGQQVDLGPHRFFSSDPRVNSFWLDATESRYRMVSRQTRILYSRSLFDYPLRPLNALRGLGLFEAVRCVLSYLAVMFRPGKFDESKFDGWVSKRFGTRLYSIFFETYSRKLWGIEPSSLDADFAAQRIKGFNLLEALKSAFKFATATEHKTLVDEFAYPLGGAGRPYENLSNSIVQRGGKVLTNQRVSSLQIAGDGTVGIKTETGDSFIADRVISTMPFTALVKLLGANKEVERAASRLKFRSTILAYLRVSGANPFPDQWIYVHAPKLRTGRITNFSNWGDKSQINQTGHVLCLEYWSYFHEELWTMSDEELVELAKSEILGSGLLLPDNTVEDGEVRRVPNCYPVYESGYRQHLDILKEFVGRTPTIHPIGRYGSFKYNNQDHSILMGLMLAENLLSGAEHDLWSINTDYEYQEQSRIDATGLVIDAP